MRMPTPGLGTVKNLYFMPRCDHLYPLALLHEAYHVIIFFDMHTVEAQDIHRYLHES